MKEKFPPKFCRCFLILSVVVNLGVNGHVVKLLQAADSNEAVPITTFAIKEPLTFENSDPPATTEAPLGPLLLLLNEVKNETFPLFGEKNNPFLPAKTSSLGGQIKPTAVISSDKPAAETVALTENATLLNSDILYGIRPQQVHTKLSCTCGTPLQYHKNCEDIENVDHNDCKIVGGQAAFIRDFPWTVALVRRYSSQFGNPGSGKPFCGGTLINNRFVLTASHCVDGQSARDIQILVNEQDLNSESDTRKTQKIDAQQIIMHHAYSRQTIDNDIALILLAKSVDISSPVSITRPACISGSATDFSGSTATVVGWGATTQGGATSNTLQKVDVPVISNTDCNEKTTYGGKITENMLCAGDINLGGRDSCQGDSGGPLIATHGGRKTLIGIVSWGHGCAQPRSPGVYTRVTRYAEWILQNTRQGDWCDG